MDFETVLQAQCQVTFIFDFRCIEFVDISLSEMSVDPTNKSQSFLIFIGTLD